MSPVRKIGYVDMDGARVDFMSARPHVPDDVRLRYLGHRSGRRRRLSLLVQRRNTLRQGVPSC